MSNTLIRFGAGSSESAKSTTWSLSTGGAQTYLIRRFKGEAIKFSFHSSGDWRIATIPEKTKSNELIIFEWRRPNPVYKNWVLGPTIVMPPIQTKKSIQPPENYKRKINWLIPPSESEERISLIASSNSELNPENFLAERRLKPDWYDYLPIKDDGRAKADRVWIFSWLNPIEDHISKIFTDIKVHLKRRADPNKLSASFYPLFAPNEAEKALGLSPTFVDIIPGIENLYFN